MKRSELEKKLKALGWVPTGEFSGINHTQWAHPNRPGKLAVPIYDLVLDSSAESLLIQAEVRIR